MTQETAFHIFALAATMKEMGNRVMSFAHMPYLVYYNNTGYICFRGITFAESALWEPGSVSSAKVRDALVQVFK